MIQAPFDQICHWLPLQPGAWAGDKFRRSSRDLIAPLKTLSQIGLVRCCSLYKGHNVANEKLQGAKCNFTQTNNNDKV